MARLGSAPAPPAVARETRIIEHVVVNPPPVNVRIQLPEKKNALADPSTYAPAAPGLLVALFGLWAAHALAQRRDRKKAIYDLCETLKKLADEASAAAVLAWLENDSALRVSSIASTKRLLQSTGITATTLKRRTLARQTWARPRKFSIWPLRVFERRSIDLIREVAALRSVTMSDPFEDPNRNSDGSRVDRINAAVSMLYASVDRALFDYQG
jgi:hypothetical protein